MSVIRQKDESQNGCYKKTKHATFSEKRTLFPPATHTCYFWFFQKVSYKWESFLGLVTYCYMVYWLSFFLWHTMHCDRDGFFIYHKHPHSCHLFSRYYRNELFWKLILARHYLCSWNKVSLFSHWFLLNWNVFSVILVAKITLAHLLLR